MNDTEYTYAHDYLIDVFERDGQWVAQWSLRHGTTGGKISGLKKKLVEAKARELCRKDIEKRHTFAGYLEKLYGK